MAKCIYPKCYSCTLDYCIKDTKPVKETKKKDRTEYQRKRYQNHKEEIRANYNSQTQYVKWVELKKTINGIKKELGINNYKLIMGEIEKLERFKHS